MDTQFANVKKNFQFEAEMLFALRRNIETHVRKKKDLYFNYFTHECQTASKNKNIS